MEVRALGDLEFTTYGIGLSDFHSSLVKRDENFTGIGYNTVKWDDRESISQDMIIKGRK